PTTACCSWATISRGPTSHRPDAHPFLLASEGVHRRNRRGARGGNDRGDKCAGGERAGGDTERQRIPERYAVQLRGNQASCADRQRQAEHETDDDALECAAEYEIDDPAAIGAERHPDPDLVRALRDGVRGDAVETDGGEHERDDPEQTCQARNGTLLIE